MQGRLNRRHFLVGTISALGLSRPALGLQRAFDIAATDGSPIRNFPFPAALSPADLNGVLFSGALADLTLYEFVDYACGSCRAAAYDLNSFANAGLRLGVLQHPVVSPQSKEAARMILAAAKLQGDGFAYRLHQQMLRAPGQPAPTRFWRRSRRPTGRASSRSPRAMKPQTC